MTREEWRKAILVIGGLALILAAAWWIRSVLVQPGWARAEAMVLDVRVEDGPTADWRLYDRDHRYVVDVRFDDHSGATHVGRDEVSPFDYRKLRTGGLVKVLYRPENPAELRIHDAPTWEVFLIVLGIGTLLASLALIIAGRRLEARVR